LRASSIRRASAISTDAHIAFIATTSRSTRFAVAPSSSRGSKSRGHFSSVVRSSAVDGCVIATG